MTLLLAVLFVNLRSTASTPLAHLLLHLPQALIQQVSLQQTGQLVLRKIARILKKKLFKRVGVGRNGGRGDNLGVNKKKLYLWRLLIHSSASFGKFLHVFEYFMLHFRRQAGKLLRVDVHRVGVVVQLPLHLHQC